MRTLLALLALSLLLAPSASGATLVTYFQGTIGTVEANPGQILGNIAPGQPISGFFTFNDDPAAKIGNDQYAATISFTLPTRTLTLASNYNYIRARNNDSQAFRIVDSFSHGFDGPGGVVDSLILSGASVYLTDHDAAVFTATPPLPPPLRLADFESATWYVSGSDAANPSLRFHVSGSITALAVPEPTSVASALFALTAMALTRRPRP